MPLVPRRWVGVDQVVELVGGKPVPEPNPNGSHLARLLDECAEVVHCVRFDETLGGGLAEAGQDGPGRYVIRYNPGFVDKRPGIDVGAWKSAAMLHEMMHVSCALKYLRPTVQGLQIEGFNNFHVPRNGVANDINDSLRRQRDVAVENFDRLETALKADIQEMRIPAAPGAHLQKRIDYGQLTSNVHYETVLLDIMVYMALADLVHWDMLLSGLVEKMSKEAETRRNSAIPYELEILV